ncbi:hypothetical protein PORY_000426 [Pneumocystis oryctolagi]|uniref:Uncharacterized protein n=1 Tax=Pneumocystis oryctolagi TaxID=42067 RepID=A0ACB7CGX5_9ASCO|nr:hypothetical protein PORY_000426 [Pneumocystis oryctolagi]
MNKKNFLLINKADLMTLKQRKYWADYFKVKKIRYTFFSAILGENVNECHNNADIFNTCENINRIENNSNKNNLEDNILDNSENTDKNDNFFEDEETKIVTVNQLKDMFLKEMQILKNDKGYNINSFKKFHVGLVGYPNVGKSSTINSLIGKKKVSISSTPGRTKHFQTIHITDKLVLCDCPGLVFPNFSVTKADLVCSGVLPIDQLQDYIDPISLILHRISKHVLELTYGITMEAESVEDDETEIFTAENFLTKYSISRGIDKSTASRHIIKDYVSGKLLFCNPPPGIDPFVFNSEHFDSFKLSTRKYSQKNDLVNISSKKMLKNSEKECFELQESKNNKLSAFDRDFFCRNKLFLELNQKNKGLYYKKYIGSTAVHSYEYNFQNMLNKSKKHFKAYKRKITKYHVTNLLKFNIEMEDTSIQPMHQGNLELQRQGNIASPTDDLMSPTTAKLQAHKRKAKPQSLQSVFTQIQSDLNESTIQEST